MTEIADRDPEWTEKPPFTSIMHYDQQTLAVFREANAIRTIVKQLSGYYGELLAHAAGMDKNMSVIRKDTGEALYDAGRIYDAIADMQGLVKSLDFRLERNTEAVARNTEVLEKLVGQSG